MALSPSELAARLPVGFRLGAATAAYQVEGGWDADGKGPSIWDTFLHAGHGSGDTGDVACDHYHRWPGDLDLMADLGLQAYRFSVSWPRVMPSGRGPANPAGLAFYDRLVDGLLERGIDPFVTLYHWDLPQALQDEGGWAGRDVADRFADYAALLAEALGDRVRGWMTLNEPQAIIYPGYISGAFAPGVRDARVAMQVSHHLLLAHGRAVQALHAGPGDAGVGLVMAFTPYLPKSADPADISGAEQATTLAYRLFLDPMSGRGYPDGLLERLAGLGMAPDVREGDLAVIGAPLDFLGVNYYTRMLVDGSFDILGGAASMIGPEDAPRSEMGWEVVPEGLTHLLQWLGAEYDFPAYYVTENGMALADQVTGGPAGRAVADPARIDYIARHLEAALPAIEAGFPLRGWFVWSFMDNLEWDKGFAKRFGLVHVDFDTLERTIKDSGHWYRQLLQDLRGRQSDV